MVCVMCPCDENKVRVSEGKPIDVTQPFLMDVRGCELVRVSSERRLADVAYFESDRV